VVQSTLLTNPTVSLSFMLPEGGGLPKLDFGLTQQIVDLWQIPVRKKVAQAQLEATILDVAQRAVTLAFDVRARAVELLAIQRGEATLRENLELVEQSFQLAQRQFEAGVVSQLDVNLTRVNVIDVRLELIATQRERQVAEAALARLLNISADGRPWSLRDALPAPGAAPAGELLTLALQQRLDARVAEARVDQAEADLRMECLKVFPSIEAGFGLERSEQRALPGRNILADTARESIANGALTAPTIQSRAERALERRQIIDVMLGPSLAFTLPVFDQNQAQIAKARYRVIQRRKDYEDLVDKVANEVDEASKVARTVESLVSFFNQQALPQGQISVEGARRLYEAGQQSISVLLEAQESFVARRRAYVRALGEHALATVELERAVGGRLPPAPATQPAATQPGDGLNR
jgi:cobalt-zinc-cadmium efflux system outer membrane protein